MKLFLNGPAKRGLVLFFLIGMTEILGIPAQAGTAPTPVSSYLPASQSTSNAVSPNANALVKTATVTANTSSSTSTSSNSTTVVVLGTSGPWDEGANPDYTYGTHDESGPTVFPITAGESLTLTYLSGTVSAGLGWPNDGAEGDTSYPENGGRGSSGQTFPSLYMSPYPIYLDELVGAFTDASGVIVGSPFSVGVGPTKVTAPAGATQLELGVNDDVYHDNVGAYSVQITGSSTTFAIQSTTLTQAVPNFSIDNAGSLDLVLGKKAIFQTFISGSNIDTSNGGSVTVQVQAPGSPTPMSSSVPLSLIASAPAAGYEVDFFFTPSSAGSSNLVVTVDPGMLVEPSPTTSNIPVNVDQTRNLNVGFVGINGCTAPATDCYSSHLTEFDSAVQNMSTFIQAVYPIADQGSSLGVVAGNPAFSGTVVSAGPSPDFTGMAQDLLNLSIMAKLSSPSLDYVGGIVPSGYFTYHHMTSSAGPIVGYNGIELNQHSFLVEEDAWTGAAHELGHLFTLTDLYGTNGSCNDLVSGYWPSDNPPLPISNLPELMCGSQPNNPLANWIGQVSFSTIFKLLEQPATDPEVLLVTGLLTSSGEFQSSALYHSLNGTLSASETGNFSVNVLDPTGKVISTLSQNITFQADLDPVGVVSVNAVPIVVSVPYASNADQVQIVFNKKTIASYSPNSELLVDAIKAIPSAEYKRNPLLGSWILLGEANLISDFLKQGQTWVAILIAEDLKAQAGLLLNPSFQKTDPRQTSQADLIMDINSVISRLQTIATSKGNPRNTPNDVNTCKKAIGGFSSQ